MKHKHKHADLIREWALDTSKVVQYAASPLGEWQDCAEFPTWGTNFEYRFKPEPKPDYHAYAVIMNNSLQVCYVGNPNVKFTFDGETRQLKAVEMLK
jgi:hypothetical protein